MITRLFPIALALALATSAAWSHGNEKHPAAGVSAGRDVASAQISVPAAASAAVAAVERFSTALGKGELKAASAELDADVLILESGGVERTRAEYLGGHAKSDADFLKQARVTLQRRTAHASGDLVWVASESDMHVMKGKEVLNIASTETMVVQRTTGGWKIVHIHWSSRSVKDKH